VLYHRSNAGGASMEVEQESIVVEEIRQTYRGQVVAARDLDVFE
jgi:hypothetical protein